MTDDTQRSDNKSEFDESVFKPDEPESAPEPVFDAEGGSSAQPPQPEASSTPPAIDSASPEPEPPNPVDWGERAPDSNASAAVSDAERAAEPVFEEEYRRFDESSAVETPDTRRRQLGRSGPLWMISIIALLIIVAVVWLALRSSPAEETLSATVEELPTPTAVPTTQPSEEPTPTSELPTPTPIPVELPPGAHVTVGDNAEVDGVKLREEPGKQGGLVAILFKYQISIPLDGGGFDENRAFEDGEEDAPFVFEVLGRASEDESYPVAADG